MMPEWSTACRDWETRLIEGKSLIPFDPLFPDEARKSLEVFKSLRIVDVAGSPTIGECCEQWVLDFAAAIFGAYDAETGKRLIREFYLLVSKKNSKSTIAAGIMLTALIRNWRNSAEFLIVAPTIEVAQNSFKPASDMIKSNELLSDLFHVQSNIRAITHKTTGAVLKVLAADNDTVSGKKATGVLIDEHWLFGKKPNADAMLREATGGIVSRPEGFVIYLSTQSDEPPVGVFKAKLDYFRAVRDGKIKDNKSLGVLYEWPAAMLESKAYLDPKNFYLTNPNLGRSVSKEWLEDELKKEEHGDGATLRTFLSKHLNVEIGLALRSDNWAGAEFWPACVDDTITVASIIERCDVVVVGIDGGGLDDLLGLAILGREKGTGHWLLWNHAWAHEIVKQRRKEIAPKLDDLAKRKELTIVKLPGQDVAELADIVMQIEKSGLLAEGPAIGVDTFGVTDIVKELTMERGIDPDRIVGIPQGWQLNGAIKTAERNLAGGNLLHAGLDLMTFAVGNAKVEPKGNALTITKQVSGSAKIDPLMATFNTVVLMGKNPEAAHKDYDLFMVA